MSESPSAYGLWSLVIVNSAVFIIFALSFAKPQTKRDWRSFGAFSAFIVALFTEMYGFPLTIYLLSGWLGRQYPGVDFMSHDAGHLLEVLLGWRANPHFGPFHILSSVLIFIGFALLASAWRVLYAAQRVKQLATTGPYAYVRHPQYVGFALILFGFLLQWPTVLTVLMFPVLLVMYWRLALHEEKEIRARFGRTFDEYAVHTPRFFPKWQTFRRSVVPVVLMMLVVPLALAAESNTQRSLQNGVTISVTSQGTSRGGADRAFTIVMDTHTRDLNDDLTTSAVLVDSAGKQYAPVAWEGAAPGGHHREGVLRFRIENPAPGPLELRLERAGESNPRIFRW